MNDARSNGTHVFARQHAWLQRVVDVSHERQQGADEGEELHVPGAEACEMDGSRTEGMAGGGPHLCCHGVRSNASMRSRRGRKGTVRTNGRRKDVDVEGRHVLTEKKRVLQVVVNEGEPPESALRRFRRAVMSSGVIPEVREDGRGRRTVHAWMQVNERMEKS